MAEEISVVEFSGRPIVELGRYSGTDETYQEVFSWIVREGYQGVLFEVSFVSSNYGKTELRLTFKQGLTGTLTFTNGNTAVTGSGTAFTTELEVGDKIILDDDIAEDSTDWAEITSIESNTALTLTSAYTGTGGSGDGSKVWGFYDKIVQAALSLPWKDNKLASETEVKLEVQSSDGTSITVDGSLTGKLLATT